MDGKEEYNSAIHVECGKFMEKKSSEQLGIYWKCPECNTLVKSGSSVKLIE